MNYRIHLEYVMDTVCKIPLEGVALVGRGYYTEVTPRTVALRLMENSKNDLKELGMIVRAQQDVTRETSVLTTYGGFPNKLPGRTEVYLTIDGLMFPEVAEEDWQEIRPDLSLNDFRGVLCKCEKTLVY